MPNMTTVEKLQRDIDTLNEAIRLHWVDLDAKATSEAERTAGRAAIESLRSDLAYLIRQKDEANAHRS